MPFNLRSFLRHVSPDVLKAHVGAKAVAVPANWWSFSALKLASELARLLVTRRDESSAGMLADLVRAAPMATEAGQRALRTAVARRPEIVETLSKLGSDEARALWVLVTNEDLFRQAEECLFVDYYSEGKRGSHYTTQIGLVVSRDDADIAAFKGAVCEFHQRHDYSGISCIVECAERADDDAIQIAIYLQGIPSDTVEVVDGTFHRRIARPVLEEAILYEATTGHTITVAKGGKNVHE